MKVLMIGTTDILGGAAKISWQLKSALEARGDQVTLYVADKRSNNEAVKVIPRPYWRKVVSVLLADDRWFSTDWLLETEDFKNADIIHCHNLHGRYFNLATLVKMSKVKPVIWTLHDEWALTPHCAYTLDGTTLKNGLYVCPSLQTEPRLLWDNTARLTAIRSAQYDALSVHLVTPSQWLYDRVGNTVLRGKPRTLINNGIDTTAFKPVDREVAREALGLPRDKKIVLFLATAGKANTWKGWVHVESVLKTYRNRDDVVFLSVGGLSPEASVDEQVIYRPHVSDAATLAQYYSAADVLLFTSLADNFPLVILEAMACGLPIVGFRVGGVPEQIVDGETGYLAPYGDTVRLTEALTAFLALPKEKVATMRAATRSRVDHTFRLDTMIDRYLALYTTLCNHHD